MENKVTLKTIKGLNIVTVDGKEIKFECLHDALEFIHFIRKHNVRVSS